MAGEFRLEGPERRKLIKELREEFKPLCSQIADFQIEKATQVLKLQIRKLENEMTVEDQKLHARVDREIKSAKDTIRNEVRVLELDLKQSVRSIQRQRARDKADHDRQNEAHIENIKAHAAKLEEHASWICSGIFIVTNFGVGPENDILNFLFKSFHVDMTESMCLHDPSFS